MAKSSFFKDGGAGTNTAAAIQNQLDQAAASAAQAATSLASIGTELADATAAKVAAEAAQAAAETAKTASENARDTAITNRNAADASASSASTSATNSQTSETNSAASQSAAATSAANAATSETNAAASQAAAATSAANAATSETNAAASATSSATAQAASETARDASVVAKTASETAKTGAETAETNSAASQSAAATSAANAATSESNASTSAANAATSATGASSSASSAASAQTAAEAARDSALAAFDSFDDRFLGNKSSDPSTDNDGDALVAGSLYYNTTDNVMKVYTGSAWVAAFVSGGSFAQLSGATFTGDVTVPNLITAGNVDGRDVSADGTKLDGIATGATAVSSLTDLSISDGTNGQALKTDGAGNFSFGDVASSTAFTDITGKPTTLSGYGITDALPNNANGVTSHPLRTNGGQFRVGDTSYAMCLSTNGQGASASIGHTAGNDEGIFWHTSNNYGIYRTSGAWTNPTYQQLKLDWPTGVVISTSSRGTYSYSYTNIEQSLNVGGNVQIGTQSVLNGLGQLGIYGANPYIAWYHSSTTRSAYMQYLVSGDRFYFGEISSFQSAGNVTAYASDERLKKDFTKVENALEKVCSLEGVTYQWDKEKCQDVGFKAEWDKTEIGLRAQQVEKVFPEVVTQAPFDVDEEGNSKSGDDYLTMYYDRLVPVLIEAIKELKAEVEELKAGCCHGTAN